MSIEIAYYISRVWGLCWKTKKKKEVKKYVPKSCAFPVLAQGSEKSTLTHLGEGTEYAPVLWVEDGTENAAICVERQWPVPK